MLFPLGELQQVAKIVETLHLLEALLIYPLPLTLQPPPSLISVASKTKKKWCKLKQSTLKGGEGKGSGKGLNSRYGGYWKLEKVFFCESVSKILQLVVTANSAKSVSTVLQFSIAIFNFRRQSSFPQCTTWRSYSFFQQTNGSRHFRHAQR